MNARQWLDLGNINDTSCFVRPGTCTQGFTLSFLMKHIDHANRFGGYVSAIPYSNCGPVVAHNLR